MSLDEMSIEELNFEISYINTDPYFAVPSSSILLRLKMLEKELTVRKLGIQSALFVAVFINNILCS